MGAGTPTVHGCERGHVGRAVTEDGGDGSPGAATARGPSRRSVPRRDRRAAREELRHGALHGQHPGRGRVRAPGLLRSLSSGRAAAVGALGAVRAGPPRPTWRPGTPRPARSSPRPSPSCTAAPGSGPTSSGAPAPSSPASPTSAATRASPASRAWTPTSPRSGRTPSGLTKVLLAASPVYREAVCSEPLSALTPSTITCPDAVRPRARGRRGAGLGVRRRRVRARLRDDRRAGDRPVGDLDRRRWACPARSAGSPRTATSSWPPWSRSPSRRRRQWDAGAPQACDDGCGLGTADDAEGPGHDHRLSGRSPHTAPRDRAAATPGPDGQRPTSVRPKARRRR